MALIETITDNFNDNVIDTVLWDKFETGGTITETGQQISISLPTSTISNVDITSDATYDFTGSSITIKLIEYTPVGSQTGYISCGIAVWVDSNNSFSCIISLS